MLASCAAGRITGLTFSYNVTIGIPLYIEINRVVGQWFPGT